MKSNHIHLLLIPGDAEEVAHKVAQAVGISSSNVHANVKPGGKAALIQKLQSQGLRYVKCSYSQLGVVDDLQGPRKLQAPCVSITFVPLKGFLFWGRTRQ